MRRCLVGSGPINKPKTPPADAAKADDDADAFLASVQFPDDCSPSDEEEMKLTLARLEEWERTRIGVPWEDVKAWLQARRTNPNAPRPIPRKSS